MRVIAGKWGGRILPARVPAGTRPTQDVVREAIFNMLSSRIQWDGVRVLDLFAGTGAFGIESLSRGASWCTFVERAPQARKAIAENCRTLGIDRTMYCIVGGDAAAYLKQSEEQFHIVFADPPYSPTPKIHRFWGEIGSSRCIAEGTLVVFEHAAALVVPTPIGFSQLQHRQWGQTACTIIQRQYKKPAPQSGQASC